MKFEDVYGKAHRRELSQSEAAEILGMSERTFRRWRDRFEAEGLYGRRLGKVSGRRVPVNTVMKVLEQLDTRYFGSAAKHFWDKPVSEHGFKHGYNWIRPTLRADRRKAKAPSSMARGAWPSTKRTERAGRKRKTGRLKRFDARQACVT